MVLSLPRLRVCPAMPTGQSASRQSLAHNATASREPRVWPRMMGISSAWLPVLVLVLDLPLRGRPVSRGFENEDEIENEKRRDEFPRVQGHTRERLRGGLGRGSRYNAGLREAAGLAAGHQRKGLPCRSGC